MPAVQEALEPIPVVPRTGCIARFSGAMALALDPGDHTKQYNMLALSEPDKKVTLPTHKSDQGLMQEFLVGH
jgi:hypothetical protein